MDWTNCELNAAPTFIALSCRWRSRSQDQTLTSAYDLFDRFVSKTGSAWESRKDFETKCLAARCHSPRHRCHRAGLEGSLGCRELPRVLGYFSSASYFSPAFCFMLMYVMQRIRSASAAT